MNIFHDFTTWSINNNTLDHEQHYHTSATKAALYVQLEICVIEIYAAGTKHHFISAIR